MRAWLWILPLVALLWSVVAVPWATQGQDEADSASLAGAQTVIDAAEYPDLQAALDALPETGGIVQLPPGEFEITVPLTLQRGDVKLVGSGTATHIRNLNRNQQPALLIAHPDGRAVNRDDRLWRVHVSDLRITGNPESGHGLEAQFIEEIYLEGITVSENGGDGIRLDNCYEDPRIANCLITYNRQVGLNLLGCHDIVVDGNQFEENQDALHCIDSYNLCMTGNNLDDHLGDGVIIHNTYGSVVSGNMIEECQGTAIVLDHDCYGDTLSANVIAHNGAGIRLVDAHGCAVSANTFTIMQTDALWIGPDSDRIAVTGNNFCDSYIGAAEVRRAEDDRAAGGLVLENTSDIAISGNVFASVKPKAIELRGEPSRRITLSGNAFVDVTSDHTQLPPGPAALR